MITGRQEQIYEVIKAFRKQHGISPTYEEIRDELGLSSKDMVSREIQALEDAKLITRRRRIARGLRVVEERRNAITPSSDNRPSLSSDGSPRVGIFVFPTAFLLRLATTETITVTADISGCIPKTCLRWRSKVTR